MEIQVIFFGSITDITNTNQIMISGCVDTQSLMNELINRFPSIVNKKYFVAVNQKMIQENTLLNAEDTVALMPPFSGG
jgi:molybdopterin synthase sulfur carrier subunit